MNCALTSASRHHSALATLRFESVIGKSPPLSHDAPRLHTPAGCMSHEHALAPSGSHPATPNPTTDLALSNRQRTFPLIPPLVLPGRILPHLRTPAADLAPHPALSHPRVLAHPATPLADFRAPDSPGSPRPICAP